MTTLDRLNPFVGTWEVEAIFPEGGPAGPAGRATFEWTLDGAFLLQQITVPIEFVLQWDDEHIPRRSGLALFDAFASQEKTLHANAGRHKEVPRFEADSAVRFFARHLGRPVTSPA